MSVLGFIRHFLALLVTRLNFTAENSSPLFSPVLVCLVAIRFLFQHGNLLKTKLKRFLKRSLQYQGSYTTKEKCKPGFSIFKSVFMNGMSYHYRELANPVAYFCTETRGSKASDESESNSDEGSSHDKNEDSVENQTKVEEIDTDDYVTCKSSKAVYERIPTSQIIQKRKADTEKSENSKRSKSIDSLKVGKASKQMEINSDDDIETSSETSRCCNDEVTSSVSDLQLAHVPGESSKHDQIDELSEISDESLSTEKSKNLMHPSPVSSSSRDKKPSVEDLHRKNSKDKSVESSGREKFYHRDSTLKNTVPICPTKRKASKSVQTENTNKSYPNPKKTWKKMQDKPCNTPSDPRIREKKTSESKSHSSISSQGFGITKDNTSTQQNISSYSNTEAIDVKKYSESSTDHFKNELECPLIFPQINVSALLIEQTEQLKNLESQNFDANENIPEVTRQFFKNLRNENKKVAVQTSDEYVNLESPPFSTGLEGNSEIIDSKSTSVEVSDVSSYLHECTSTDESRNIKDELLNQTSKVKTYPGLSLQPLKVKKDARYQKKFYKERKEIALPKKLGEVLQWAATKPREELTLPSTDALLTDEKDLPIDEYHEQAQVLTQSIMIMFDTEKEKRARKKLEKKRRKEQKERMRRENTVYIESSFKDESLSSESSSDSMPTPEDSPKKASTTIVSSLKIPPDCDISMVEVSPLKPIAKVSPRLSPQISHQAQPQTPNTEHVVDMEIVPVKQPSDTKKYLNFSLLSVFIRFIDSREGVYPKMAIFDRDMLSCPSTDITKKNQLKSFFGIESVALVSCTGSVEEFLWEMRKTQEIYYDKCYDDQRRDFETFRGSMIICVIPFQVKRRDNDSKFDEISLVRREHRTVPEHNFPPFAHDLDSTLDVDVPELEIFETASESRPELIPNLNNQNLNNQATSQASSMPQSHEIHARDSSARTFHSADWTLHEIELSDNKSPWESSGEYFSQNIPTQNTDTKIESKMEGWTADSNQPLAISGTKNEEMRPWQKSFDSSIESLPILFGYPSQELLSQMKLWKIPQNRQSWSSSWSGSEQSASPNRRKTKSESSMHHGSNLNPVEQKNPLQETQTTHDVSNLSQKKPAGCAREKLSGKLSETVNPPCDTEIDLSECTTTGKGLKYFESSTIASVSGQHESPGGHKIIAEGSVNKGSTSFSSAAEKNTESMQQIYESRSTPEKDNSSTSDSDKLSSDSEASEKEQRKK